MDQNAQVSHISKDKQFFTVFLYISYYRVQDRTSEAKRTRRQLHKKTSDKLQAGGRRRAQNNKK